MTKELKSLEDKLADLRDPETLTSKKQVYIATNDSTCK